MRLTRQSTHSPRRAVKSNPSGPIHPKAMSRRASAGWPRELTNDGSVPKRHRRQTRIRQPIVPALELPSWLHQRRSSPKEFSQCLETSKAKPDGGISAN
jgi:hypothetical protein